MGRIAATKKLVHLSKCVSKFTTTWRKTAAGSTIMQINVQISFFLDIAT